MLLLNEQTQLCRRDHFYDFKLFPQLTYLGIYLVFFKQLNPLHQEQNITIVKDKIPGFLRKPNCDANGLSLRV